jgi:hypothetical protein
MSTVVAPSAFKTGNITFSAVKILESGGKQAYVNYSGAPLLMQVGSLETPFGMSTFDKVQPPKHSVELNLRGYEDSATSPGNAATFNALNSLDEFMVEQGVKNSRQWFKQEMSRDVVSALYTPTLRFAKDTNGARKPYPPTLKIQLRRKGGDFDVEIYDNQNNLVKDTPLDEIIVKRAYLTVLMQCTGVWFAGGKFGLSWKAVQIRADKIPMRIRGPAFLPDDSVPGIVNTKSQFAALEEEEDDEYVNDEEALAPPPRPAMSKPQPSPPPVEDDDNESTSVDPVPVPKKPVKLVKKPPPKK